MRSILVILNYFVCVCARAYVRHTDIFYIITFVINLYIASQ